jgi:hypothetical protein
VFSAIAVFHMLSLDLPPWVLQSIGKVVDKVCRAFFGRDLKILREDNALLHGRSCATQHILVD